MIVVPVYNRLIVPDADIYFRTDQFKCLAGRAVKGEKVVLLVCKEDVKRSGVKRAFIPKDNEDDLRDVPQEVKDQITVIPVRTVREVPEQTGVLTDERNALKSA